MMRSGHRQWAGARLWVVAPTALLFFAGFGCSSEPEATGNADNNLVNWEGSDVDPRFGKDSGSAAQDAGSSAANDSGGSGASDAGKSAQPDAGSAHVDAGSAAPTDAGGPADAGTSVDAKLCNPCSESKQCAIDGVVGALCIDRGELGNFCGVPCKADKECPEDYDCQAVTGVEGTTSKQCVPADVKGKPGDCTCSAAAIKAKLATHCVKEASDKDGKPLGSCKGVRKCTELGLTKCDAPAPGPEACDQKDNDCDGETDEGTCDDKNACTTDFCGAKGCVNTPTTGGLCDDGDTCTIGEICANGVCKGGQTTCQCKTDADCFSGDLCQGQVYCDKSKAQFQCKKKTPPVACSKAGDTTCAKNVCDPVSGKCFMTAVAGGSPCDDGDKCTTNDACAQGKCKPGKSTCECKSDADCKAKDDGNDCNGVLVCDKAINKCAVDKATIVQCQPPANTCLKNPCNPATGKCSIIPMPAGTACNDGDPCSTGDFCKAGNCMAGKSVCECKSYADCAGKNAGDLCIGTFTCQANKCVKKAGSGVVCAKLNDTGCMKNTCQPKTGKCSLAALPDGAICQTKGACGAAGKCVAGQCQAAGGKLCDDTNPCTTDKCDAQTGKCAHTNVPDGTPCGAGKCDKGACTGGQKVSVKAPAIADTWIENATTNFGHWNLLIVARSGNYGFKRTLIKFDTSKVPKGAKVAKATLRVYVSYWHDAKSGKDTPIDRPIDVHRMLRAWSEKKVTAKSTGLSGLHKYWKADKVAFDDFDASKTPIAQAVWAKNSNGWKDFDITATAQAWVDDASKNHGVLLRATNETKTGREPRMHSREAKGGGAGLKPHLLIEYFAK